MKSILRISDFNEVVTGLKAMKSDLLCVYGQYLIGVDNTMGVVKTYTMNKSIPVEPFTIITKELSSEFYANITDVEIIIDTDNGKIYCPNNKSYADNKENPMIDIYMTNAIIDKFMILSSYLTHPMRKVVEFGDITEDIGFQNIKNLKSPEGAQLYLPKGNIEYGMYLYNGALPIVKADKVSLIIYDFGDTFIGNFIVQKKKLNPINVYFRFIKVNRMR